eukprot:1847946-Prymnesium_polylepis.1
MPPGLASYIHMLFGMASMGASDWPSAEASLRAAVLAAGKTPGRRVEEASNQLALVLYMAGQIEAAHLVCSEARDLCLSRHDPQMLAQLTVGACVGLLHADRHAEAAVLLEDLKQKLPPHLRCANPRPLSPLSPLSLPLPPVSYTHLTLPTICSV